MKKKGTLRKVVDYFAPFAYLYDQEGESQKIAKELGVDVNRVRQSVNEAYMKKKNLLVAAKVADTGDRITSTFGGVIEAIGTLLGAAPGWLLNGGEEIIEMVAKVPALGLLYKDPSTRHYVTGLLVREGATAALPAAGDVYDIATNKYISTASNVISESAREKVRRGLVDRVQE